MSRHAEYLRKRRASDPEYAERSRQDSRRAKARRKTICTQCATNLIHYTTTSGVCQACYIANHTPDHGTTSRYTGGCRCSACRAAWAAYNRRRVADRKTRIANLPAEKHGNASTYRNWGCRCDACRTAWSYDLKQRELRRMAS